MVYVTAASSEASRTRAQVLLRVIYYSACVPRFVLLFVTYGRRLQLQTAATEGGLGFTAITAWSLTLMLLSTALCAGLAIADLANFQWHSRHREKLDLFYFYGLSLLSSYWITDVDPVARTHTNNFSMAALHLAIPSLFGTSLHGLLLGIAIVVPWYCSLQSATTVVISGIKATSHISLTKLSWALSAATATAATATATAAATEAASTISGSSLLADGVAGPVSSEQWCSWAAMNNAACVHACATAAATASTATADTTSPNPSIAWQQALVIALACIVGSIPAHLDLTRKEEYGKCSQPRMPRALAAIDRLAAAIYRAALPFPPGFFIALVCGSYTTFSLCMCWIRIVTYGDQDPEGNVPPTQMMTAILAAAALGGVDMGKVISKLRDTEALLNDLLPAHVAQALIKQSHEGGLTPQAPGSASAADLGSFSGLYQSQGGQYRPGGSGSASPGRDRRELQAQTHGVFGRISSGRTPGGLFDDSSVDSSHSLRSPLPSSAHGARVVMDMGAGQARRSVQLQHSEADLMQPPASTNPPAPASGTNVPQTPKQNGAVAEVDAAAEVLLMSQAGPAVIASAIDWQLVDGAAERSSASSDMTRHRLATSSTFQRPSHPVCEEDQPHSGGEGGEDACADNPENSRGGGAGASPPIPTSCPLSASDIPPTHRHQDPAPPSPPPRKHGASMGGTTMFGLGLGLGGLGFGHYMHHSVSTSAVEGPGGREGPKGCGTAAAVSQGGGGGTAHTDCQHGGGSSYSTGTSAHGRMPSWAMHDDSSAVAVAPSGGSNSTAAWLQRLLPLRDLMQWQDDEMHHATAAAAAAAAGASHHALQGVAGTAGGGGSGGVDPNAGTHPANSPASAREQQQQQQQQSQLQRPPTPLLASQLPMHFAEWHESVTILFADVVGFTPLSQQVTAEAVMTMLNELYFRLDSLCMTMPVYKVETIGDCYMAATGLLHDDPDHAATMVRFALAMQREAAQVLSPADGRPVQLRVGIHSGRVMSGVVGRIRKRYSLFGDTVNTASRMESTGVPGCIQVTEATHELAQHVRDDEWRWESRGTIQVKGKGLMATYLMRRNQELEPSILL